MKTIIATTALGVCAIASTYAVTGSRTEALVLKRIVPDAPKATRVALGDNRLFVLTPDDHSVAVHDLAGVAIGRVGSVGNGPGELLNPVDLVTAPGGVLWVVDKGNHRLQQFDRAGHAAAQIAVESPLSAAVTANGEVWIVAAFDRLLVRIYDKNGARVRDVGEPVRVSGLPPDQESYQSRGRVYALQTGALFMFRGLPTPKITVWDPNGQLTREIPIDSSELEGARQRATQMQNDLRKNGGFRYSGTLNGVAVDSRGVVWVCPSAPILLAYDLKSGSKREEFEMRLDESTGERIALQDIVVRGQTAYGVVAKRGIVKFELPTLSKATY